MNSCTNVEDHSGLYYLLHGLLNGLNRFKVNLEAANELVDQMLLTNDPVALALKAGFLDETLGYCGLVKNPNESRKWWTKAVDAGLFDVASKPGAPGLAQTLSAYAVLEGRGGLEKNPKEAVRIYQKVMDEGYHVAHNFMGWLYEEGKVVEQDYKKAFACYMFAAAAGDSDAQINVGRLYQEGLGVTSCLVSAEKYFKMSVAQGDLNALVTLGDFYLQVESVKDVTKALECLELAAQRDHPKALNCLGLIYDRGEDSLQPDSSKALDYFQRAARRGDCFGLLMLGNIYEHGRDQEIKRNSELSRKYYEQSAAKDNPDAQLALGVFYYRDPNHAKAFKLFRRAANQDNGMAQHCLGTLYYNGEGVERCYATALEWFEKAVKLDVTDSMTTLADIYMDNYPFERDYTKAMDYLLKATKVDENDVDLAKKYVECLEAASKHDHGEALFRLGCVYRDGAHGVTASPLITRRFLERAARQGHERARQIVRLTDIYSFLRRTAVPKWIT